MIASFTKWDNSLSRTLGASPMGVPLSEVLLYIFCACNNACSLLYVDVVPFVCTIHDCKGVLEVLLVSMPKSLQGPSWFGYI